ncbi:MAPEG family protein [Ideonella sp. YS5]|uniref:MAPEG family protein n=1 Tax=Ideonella sp. YS5 TaxID=3453714 RepID=UPI003EE8BCEE
MNDLPHLLVYTALLTWASLMVASLLRTGGITPRGMALAFGNRDDLPEPTPLAGRADRAAKNTMENFVFFAALALTAMAIGRQRSAVMLGAQIFFWARVAYLPVYWAGITYLRTAVWLVGVVGLGMMALALLAA